MPFPVGATSGPVPTTERKSGDCQYFLVFPSCPLTWLSPVPPVHFTVMDGEQRMPCGLEAVLCEPVITLVGFGFGFGFCNCPKPAGVWKLGKKFSPMVAVTVKSIKILNINLCFDCLKFWVKPC